MSKSTHRLLNRGATNASVCASKPPKILLSPAVCEDVDIAGRLQHQATELRDYGMLEAFEGPYQGL